MLKREHLNLLKILSIKIIILEMKVHYDFLDTVSKNEEPMQ